MCTKVRECACATVSVPVCVSIHPKTYAALMREAGRQQISLAELLVDSAWKLARNNEHVRKARVEL